MPELDLKLDRARLRRIRDGATVVTTEPAVFQVSGPGALSCMQGLLTNDLVQPGDDSLVYGALLTPKGAIVVDGWVLRRGETLTVVIPRIGQDAATELFRRSLPPRLARLRDLTGEMRAAWLVGAHAFHTLAKSGESVPESAARVIATGDESDQLLLALGPEAAPFVALALGAVAVIDRFAERLVAAGAVRGDAADLEASRILTGWPALGVEIDERTLPQEVRYDALGGVSYTKGCYTGQETVARLHFRGHTNRELRGLRWTGAETLPVRSVAVGGKEVGTVRSTLQLDDRTLALAMLRREVGPGDRVVAAGREAVVVGLPFGSEDVDG